MLNHQQIPEGHAFVEPRDVETARGLIAAAESIGVDPAVVRTQQGGYLAPTEVVEAWEGGDDTVVTTADDLAADTGAEEDGDQLLGISRDGQYYLNRNPIRNETLGAQLKQIYDARETDKILYIRADRQLEYSKVLDASDIASKNGVRVVGYISEQTPGTEEQSVETKAAAATKGATP